MIYQIWLGHHSLKQIFNFIFTCFLQIRHQTSTFSYYSETDIFASFGHSDTRLEKPLAFPGHILIVM